MTELHGLRSRRPFVQQGSVGHWHAGDVTNHGLVVKERLQATLRDFGLIGRVLSYPDNGTETVRRGAWFWTGRQQHKSWGCRRRGLGTVECFVCDFLVLEICRRSKESFGLTWARVTGFILKAAASLNDSNFIRYHPPPALTSLNFPADCAGWVVARSSCSNPCRCRTSTLCSWMRSSAGTPGSHSRLSSIPES